MQQRERGRTSRTPTEFAPRGGDALKKELLRPKTIKWRANAVQGEGLGKVEVESVASAGNPASRVRAKMSGEMRMWRGLLACYARTC